MMMRKAGRAEREAGCETERVGGGGTAGRLSSIRKSPARDCPLSPPRPAEPDTQSGHSGTPGHTNGKRKRYNQIW